MGRPESVGWASWLRDLPYEVPTPVPVELREKTKALHVRGAVNGSAKAAGVRVKTKAVDGEIWVSRIKGDAS